MGVISRRAREVFHLPPCMVLFCSAPPFIDVYPKFCTATGLNRFCGFVHAFLVSFQKTPEPPPEAEEEKEKASDTRSEIEETPRPTEEKVTAEPKAVPSPATEETAPAPVEVKVGSGKGLKFTVAVEVGAAGLSGDLGQYADTSWSLTSPRAGGVNPRQAIGLGGATVSMRYAKQFHHR